MKISPLLTLSALLALAFTLATGLVGRAGNWSGRAKSDNLFGMLFGDGRKLFANQFFTMADVYFHSGYYPSIFDNQAGKEGEPKAIVAASRSHEGHDHKDGDEHCDEGDSCEMHGSFLGQAKDWIEVFGRNFRITQHTHLEQQDEREILPWLRLAADLDPQKIETYTVGAFFLREHLNRADQAEAFLREGMRSNPDSAEILFELGRIYHDSYHDLARARNVWELGVKKFLRLPAEVQEENRIVYQELTVNLARLEDEAGNYGAAIAWFRKAQAVSPVPSALQGRIDALQKKMSALIPVAPSKLY